MDEQSQKTLAEITAKEPAALSESEIAFLRARRSYLNERERDVFAEFLVEAKPAADEADAKAEDKAAKKGKDAKAEDKA